jgi:hypothetical protein
MEEYKSLFVSKTFWGAAFAIVSVIAGFFGYVFGPVDQAEVIRIVTDAGALAGSLYAIWGRVVASKRIG